jgi:hypothetical protein
MFIRARRGLPGLLPTLALGLLLAGSAAAQEGRNLAEEVRGRRAIEAQRVEKEFAAGRAHAYDLVRKQPAKLDQAVERIAALQALVEQDTSLEPRRREVFRVTLDADLRRLADLARDLRDARNAETLSQATRAEVRRATSERQAEHRRGPYQEARSLIESRGRSVADARGEGKVKAERFMGVVRGLDESATPPASDYDLPSDWAEKSKRRSPAAKLTEQERSLLAALAKPITLDFDKEPFQNVIEYLQKATGQTIAVDKQALDEANVSYETPVTLRVNRVSTRTALKKLFSDLGLAYVIKGGAVQVTTQARAREMVSTRAYYIGDLVGVADVRFAPWVNQAQMAQAVNTIIDQIVNQVEPQSWKVNNPDAPGSIAFDPVTMTIIVRQTAEVHYMLDSLR